MSKLHDYLVKIQQGQSVNFTQVEKVLPSVVPWQSLFEVELVGKNKHKVSINDQVLFDTLLQQSQPAKYREDATLKKYGSSHDVNCNSAYLLCFAASNQHQHPELAAVNRDVLLPLSFKPKKHAILIENQDCFFAWQTLLAHFAHQFNWLDCDIYFSAGTQILNTKFKPLLSQYETLFCLFDYDLAGLHIALKLSQLGYAKTQYLVPAHIEKYATLFTFTPHSRAALSDMISLCKDESLSGLAHTIEQTQHFMEQEALLTISPVHLTET